MVSLRQIRYFLAVVETGSFSSAAASLFVAQPALSRQIAQLEESLGFALLVREARGVRLTPAGALYRDRVAGVTGELARAADEARGLDRGESGVLRLLHSSSVPLAGALLAACRAFADALPRARIEVDRVSSEGQLAELAGGRADLGFVRLPLLRREPSVRVETLAEEALLVALPLGHPLAGRPALTLADLADEALVSAVHRERGGLARRVADLCLAQGIVPRLAPVISRKTSQLALVGAGFGVAVIPASLASLAGPDVVCRPLADPGATASQAMLLPLAATPLAERFAEVARQAWATSALDR